MRRRHDDAGQAFPVYLTVVGGLLLLALAYFVVGEATVNRGGAQTAADAAALAAAQDKRDRLADEWVENVRDPGKWEQIFRGKGGEHVMACRRARALASRNDAHVLRCVPDGPLAYTVDVQTNEAMDESTVPGTKGRRFEAHARAAIKARCTIEPPPEEAESDVLPRLTCGGRGWDLDPEHLTDLPEPQDLFSVHLAD